MFLAIGENPSNTLSSCWLLRWINCWRDWCCLKEMSKGLKCLITGDSGLYLYRGSSEQNGGQNIERYHSISGIPLEALSAPQKQLLPCMPVDIWLTLYVVDVLVFFTTSEAVCRARQYCTHNDVCLKEKQHNGLNYLNLSYRPTSLKSIKITGYLHSIISG